jgi:predicted ATPase/serine/threonine protein kinase
MVARDVASGEILPGNPWFSDSFPPWVEAFGSYVLGKRLGAGGMGEVFLATRGAETVVVKRILPQLVENPRFLRLFLDETRIAARLIHPNIARITELGEAGGTWFVAMEHVDGMDLRELLKRSREVNHHVPLEVAIAIALNVARGLEHAHGAADAQGRQLKIVHRDVSPHNILLGRNGEVKVIDFGVAKAANKSVHTASGVLKGKFPYMAPEQASARPVDGRTDVFALGIVLWEMICARYLFRGKGDVATLRLVRDAIVPAPSSVRDDVPEAVDRVLLKALARDANERFQTMALFREALEGLLAQLAAPDLVGWFHTYDDAPGALDSGSRLALATDPQDAPTVGGDLSEPALPVRQRPTRTDRVLTRLDQEGSTTGAALVEARRLLSQVSGRPTNIGQQPTSFVGRVAELADLHQLFRQGLRLITLLGPGGTGKTRLSLQFGTQLVSFFNGEGEKGRRRGGVWFCDLTEATGVESVCSAVARALALPLAPGDATQQLGHAIAARGEVLLVMDNFEQVVAAAEETLAKWMRMAPTARFVVSSRELLRVPEETVFEVPPLRTPRESEDGRSSEAVALFIERSRSVRPTWEPTEVELKSIAEIVRQLDGMPLAIELAAARMGVLNPAQLVQRLPRRFDLLVDRRGATERQATLRGAIDWSWRMLSAAEASTLAQLSVFRGGFNAEAVPTVVSLASLGEGLDPLEHLMMLRSKSLVRAYFPLGDEQETRFGLYESIREYAHEKLAAMNERVFVEQRHTRYYLALGARLADGAEGKKTALEHLDLERDNLLSVFRRSVTDRQPNDNAARAALALDRLLTVRGPFQLLLDMLDQAIDKLGPSERSQRALALEARGRARQARGKWADAEADFVAVSELAVTSGDRALEGRAELYMGGIDRLRGQRQHARARMARALSLLQAVGDRRMQGRALSNLGALLHDLGAETEAMQTYNQALEIHREVGDRWYEGITVSNLGVPQQALGLLKQARENYQAGLSIHRELGNRRGEGVAYVNLGDINTDLEQPGAARTHYENGVTILREVGARRLEGAALVALGVLHLQYGELEDAEGRLREGVAILEELGDQRSQGIGRAALAATEALAGRLDEAEEGMAEANRLLTQVGDAGLLDALELYRAHVELGHALQTKSETQAQVLEERARRRIVHAEQPGPPDDDHPSGTPSPSERSEYVRSALRSIKGALVDHGKEP